MVRYYVASNAFNNAKEIMESLTTAKKRLHDTFYILLQSILQPQQRPLKRYSTCQKRNKNIIQHYLIKLSVYLSVCVVFFPKP